MAVFSLTTTPTQTFIGQPNHPNVFVYGICNTGSDDIDVWINDEAVASTIPPGKTIPFKRLVNGGIYKVMCAAHASTTTMDDQRMVM